MDLLSLILALLGIALTASLGYAASDTRKKRRHARKVWAQIDETWVPAEDEVDGAFRDGGRLTIANRSDWPVTDVMVLEPTALGGQDVSQIGPHAKHVERLSERTMNALGDDRRVVLQVTDARGRTWKWVPEDPHLRYLAPPRALRSEVSRRLLSGPAWDDRLARLPRRLHIVLLGEDPNIHIPGMEPDRGDWDDRPRFWAKP